MPCARNDRPLCTLTLTQPPAAYSVTLNGLSCQLDSPSEIFNIQPEVYQASVCQMDNTGIYLDFIATFSLPLFSSAVRYGHALCNSLRMSDLNINNTLSRLNRNIFSMKSSVNILSFTSTDQYVR